MRFLSSQRFALRALLLIVLLATATAQAQPAGLGWQVFLPQVRHPVVPPIFGAQIRPGNVAATVDKAVAGGINWVRYGDSLWSEIEPTPGARNWDSQALVEQELRILAEHNLTTLLVVRSAPTWAQQVPGASCARIKPEAYDAFAVFVRDLVLRYSAPPYNVRYWELWNEPDVDPRLVDPSSGFGCWGNRDEPFYGGAAYGEMLKRVYPVVKQADPNAQIVFGGLLLDCDPDAPPPDRTAADCASAGFLEGALRVGAGQAFDVLSYHGYAFWSSQPAMTDWDLTQESWKRRGGAVLGKLRFLREVLARYRLAPPILLTEVGLLCTNDAKTCSEVFPPQQASYVTRIFTRAWANGLLGAIWYTFDGPGWLGSSILDPQQQPRPAYHALSFLAEALRGANFREALGSGNLEGYRFQKGNTTYLIYWTNSAVTTTVTLPRMPDHVYNSVGQPISVTGDRLIVGFEPLIVELREGTHAP
ncbi:MAG: hypothetical protein OHK0022_39480 [Roseiflexaceae bacterium]